jgi:peroxiredoxin
MQALKAGTTAPDFTLQTTDGKSFSLHDALQNAPVVLAFFKVSCPTCQYTFPFLERIHKAYAGKFTIIGVSQNNKKDTDAFIKEYGVSFPVVLDDTKSYTVSNAYGLTNVPTIFWVEQDGSIELTSVGWARQDAEEIYRRAANLLGQKSVSPLFRVDESVAPFRAG